MILFRLFLPFFVVMGFYSIGRVAGIRLRSAAYSSLPPPHLLDFVVIVLSWLATVASYVSGHGTAVGTLIGAVVGLFAGIILPGQQRQTPGDPILSSAAGSQPLDTHLPQSWKLFAGQVGRFQSGILLNAFYFLAITPFGILVGMRGDPLGLTIPRSESFWKPRMVEKQSLEEAHRQF